jgi:hypothetical protein
MRYSKFVVIHDAVAPLYRSVEIELYMASKGRVRLALHGSQHKGRCLEEVIPLKKESTDPVFVRAIKKCPDDHDGPADGVTIAMLREYVQDHYPAFWRSWAK